MENNKKNVTPKDIINEENSTLRDEKYNQYVKDVTPTHNLFANMLKAFIIGGIICCIGQGFVNMYQALDFDKETAMLYEVISLVALSVILTGLNLYPKLAKFGGAGSIVPITGFANSVAAPAIEFKKEGQVFGIGCKIFTIAGPVILYGICFSWLLGVIYWILKIADIV